MYDYRRASVFVLNPYVFVTGPTNTTVLVVHGCAEDSDTPSDLPEVRKSWSVRATSSLVSMRIPRVSW